MHNEHKVDVSVGRANKKGWQTPFLQCLAFQIELSSSTIFRIIILSFHKLTDDHKQEDYTLLDIKIFKDVSFTVIKAFCTMQSF